MEGPFYLPPNKTYVEVNLSFDRNIEGQMVVSDSTSAFYNNQINENQFENLFWDDSTEEYIVT